MVYELLPKRGDILVFPSGDRVKIDSLSAGMVWITGYNPIPVDDLSSSGEPDIWLYTGDITSKVNKCARRK